MIEEGAEFGSYEAVISYSGVIQAAANLFSTVGRASWCGSRPPIHDAIVDISMWAPGSLGIGNTFRAIKANSTGGLNLAGEVGSRIEAGEFYEAT